MVRPILISKLFMISLKQPAPQGQRKIPSDDLGLPLSDRQRTRSVVALARNLYIRGSRILTGLAAVFVASWRRAPAGDVGALTLLACSHDLFSFSNLNRKFRIPSLGNRSYL